MEASSLIDNILKNGSTEFIEKNEFLKSYINHDFQLSSFSAIEESLIHSTEWKIEIKNSDISNDEFFQGLSTKLLYLSNNNLNEEEKAGDISKNVQKNLLSTILLFHPIYSELL